MYQMYRNVTSWGFLLGLKLVVFMNQYINRFKGKIMKFIYYVVLLFYPFQAVLGYFPVGSDSTIDIMTWNLNNFPKSGLATIQVVFIGYSFKPEWLFVTGK